MTSYLLFSDSIPNLNFPIIKPGLYCWLSVFGNDGSVADHSCTLSRSVLEKYDVVHVNFTPGHHNYIEAIRESLGYNSSTQLIANVDYATSMWENINPLDLRHQLLQADHLFHVESLGAKNLEHFLGCKVHVIPHPVNVELLKMMSRVPGDPITVTCQYHRYKATWSSYYYALRNIRARRILCNAGSNVPPNIDLSLYFDNVVHQCDYVSYIRNILSKAYCNIDLPPDITFGRGIAEAAALGVPTICSDRVDASHRLFPDLVVNPYDHTSVESLVVKLFDDTEFADLVFNYARDAVDYYDLVHSKERMMVMLDAI
jgi:hypothetical protein